MGVLQIVTATTAEPVTRTEFKTHVRVDHTDDDGLIDTLIIAAREHIESQTGRQVVVTQTYDWRRNGFPQEGREPDDYYCPNNRWDRSFKVLRPPLQSVTSITYLDAADGTSTVWASSNYDVATGWVSTKTHPRIMHGRIVEGYNDNWPASRDQDGSCIVRFVAGYGVPAYVPSEFQAAVKLLAAHWYKNREAVVTGTIATDVPLALERMIGNLSAGEL